MTQPDPIPARLAALKTTPTSQLKAQWRDLFATDGGSGSGTQLSLVLTH